jgi:predicted metal-dependent HD superfamily phosphohydrolase
VLALDPAEYGGYAGAVRAEYAHLDERTFRQGRALVLESLLTRPQLFRTDAGRRRWEARARRNLAAELALLTAATDGR